MPTVMLLIGFLLRLGLAWQDHRTLLTDCVWSDDAYLSLSVARNLAYGRGMSADGTHITNGFQPLYVFLMVPVYWMVPAEDPLLPVHVAGTLLAAAGTAAAGLFYLISLRLFSRTAALCVLFFFAVSHYFVATEVNGLETALYGLTLSATLYYYVTRFIGRPSSAPCPPTIRQGIVLGLLAGLTVLARVDAVILLVTLTVRFLWERRGVIRMAFRPAAVGTGAFLATLAPWLAANLVLRGTLVPDSGSAVRFIAIQNGWRNVGNLIGHTGPERFDEYSVPWLYYANNLLRSAVQIVTYLPLTGHAQGFAPSYLARSIERFPVGQLVAHAPRLSLAVVVIVLVVLLLGPPLIRRRTEHSGLISYALSLIPHPSVHRTQSSPLSTQHSALSTSSGWRSLLFLRFAVVGWIAAYAFYVLCPWYSHRYLYPVLALLTLGSGAVLEVFFDGLKGRRAMRGAVLGLGAAAYGFLFWTQAGHYYARDASSREPDPYTPVVPWVQAHVPSDAVIGCFQSGVLSYFLPHRVVNLDGVVNAAALRASRQRRLWEYLRREKVSYVVDWPICIERNLKPFAGVEHVPLRELHAESTMHVYQVGEP